MQTKYIFRYFNFFTRKKTDFRGDFSTFYGQRFVTAAWATRPPAVPGVLYIKNLVLVGPGDLPAPPVVVVPTVAGHC